MNKRTHIAMLIGAAFATGLVVNAGAAQLEPNNQKYDLQQQKAQSRQADNQGQSADKTASRNTEEVVGERGRNYLMSAQMPSQVLATSLIGMTMRNKAESIGTVKDLIMNSDYKLVGFVVDMSGATGLIHKTVGISWGAVKRIDVKNDVVVVNVKKAQLQQVRNYSTRQEMQDQNQDQGAFSSLE